MAGLNVHCRTAAAAAPSSDGDFRDPRRTLIVCGPPAGVHEDLEHDHVLHVLLRGVGRIQRRHLRQDFGFHVHLGQLVDERRRLLRAGLNRGGRQRSRARRRGGGCGLRRQRTRSRASFERRQGRGEARRTARGCRLPRRWPARRALAASGRRAAPTGAAGGAITTAGASGCRSAGESGAWSMGPRPPGPNPPRRNIAPATPNTATITTVMPASTSPRLRPGVAAGGAATTG